MFQLSDSIRQREQLSEKLESVDLSGCSGVYFSCLTVRQREQLSEKLENVDLSGCGSVYFSCLTL